MLAGLNLVLVTALSVVITLYLSSSAEPARPDKEHQP